MQQLWGSRLEPTNDSGEKNKETGLTGQKSDGHGRSFLNLDGGYGHTIMNSGHKIPLAVPTERTKAKELQEVSKSEVFHLVLASMHALATSMLQATSNRRGAHKVRKIKKGQTDNRRIDCKTKDTFDLGMGVSSQFISNWAYLMPMKYVFKQSTWRIHPPKKDRMLPPCDKLRKKPYAGRCLTWHHTQ